MRKQYEETLKTFFHERLICRRYELGLTQEETASSQKGRNSSFCEK